MIQFFYIDHHEENSEINGNIVCTTQQVNNGNIGSLVASNIVLGDNETAIFVEDGRIEIKCVIDEECELKYILGEPLIPKTPGYTVKLNDPISENFPFKENVCFNNFMGFKSFTIFHISFNFISFYL